MIILYLGELVNWNYSVNNNNAKKELYMGQLNNIRDWIGFASDICVLAITIYTFYKTFIYSRLSLLQIDGHYSHADGESHQIVLLNKKMSPVVVTSVKLIIDEKYLFPFSQDAPIVIEGYSTYRFSSGDIGYIEPEIRIYGDNIIVEVTLEHKRKVYLNTNGKKIWYYPKGKLEKLEQVKCITNRYNDKIIPQYAKYALLVNVPEQDSKTIFVFSNGAMTDAILGCNGLSEEVVESKKKLKDFLHEWLDQYNITFYVDDLDRWKI